MVNQQRTHWTERGAHLLLQVRAQVMNSDLRKAFGCWCLGMKARADEPFVSPSDLHLAAAGEVQKGQPPDILEIPDSGGTCKIHPSQQRREKDAEPASVSG